MKSQQTPSKSISYIIFGILTTLLLGLLLFCVG